MKQTFMKLSMLAVALFITTACSDNATDEMTEVTPTIDAGEVKFSITEAPYGADTEIGSRTTQPIRTEKMNIGESIEAEITIEHDAAPAQTRAPKAMSDGNYTIVAYKDGVRMGQEIKFTMSSGVMNITSPKKRYSEVTQGSIYTFVCFNDKVYDNNDGTFTITLANAATALIDKQSITINDDKTKAVKFTMKHVGARVRTKLMAFSDITGVNATLGYQANKVSASINYNMFTGNLITGTTKNSTAASAAQSYTITDTQHDTTLNDYLTTVTGNDYLTVLAGTKPEELVYNITSGTVYNATLNTKGDRKLKVGNAFEANGAYTLTIRLMPRYLYLFEDGKTGYLNEGDRTNHIPIALVFDKVGKRAISLWNANGDEGTRWYGLSDWRRQHNDVMYNNSADALQPAANQGKHWTWDATGSKDGTTIKANESVKYPAFYYAGKFYASSDLTSHLNGKTLAGTLNQDGVWYLPSWYEWKEAFVKLGLLNGSQITENYTLSHWKGRLVDYVFVVANGTFLQANGYTYYWSSTEWRIGDSFIINASSQLMAFNNNDKKYSNTKVRPFVAY